MLVLIAAALLLVSPLLMVILTLLRPRFTHHWLLAVACAAIAWPLVLLAPVAEPRLYFLSTWKPAALFPQSPVLLLDRTSWLFAVALSTLVLSVMLTASARMPNVNWRSWTGNLTLAGLGILAVLAGNPLTLILAWTLLDLAEFFILLLQVPSSSGRERIVISFSIRAAGVGLLAWAYIAAHSLGRDFTLDAIPLPVSVFLLLAAGLRLGVLPLNLPFPVELPLRRGLGTMLRLTSLAAGSILLVRTAQVGVPPEFAPALLGLTALAALYGSFVWVRSQDELSGRIAWILAVAALSVAGAIQAQPAVSLAWGAAGIFSGGLLFLLLPRHRNLLPLTLWSGLALSGLPFTPVWGGSLLFTLLEMGGFEALVGVVFIFVQVLLMGGYLRHALRFVVGPEVVERWVWVIYPLGLALLPLTHAAFGFWVQPGGGMTLVGILGSAATLLGVTLLGVAARRWAGMVRPGIIWQLVERLVSLRWLYRFFWGGYRTAGRVVTLVSNVLEGEGGLLWALLLLVLLTSFLAQQEFGS